MEVTVRSLSLEWGSGQSASAEDVATVLIQGGYYVRSVKVVHAETGATVDTWKDGN